MLIMMGLAKVSTIGPIGVSTIGPIVGHQVSTIGPIGVSTIGPIGYPPILPPFVRVAVFIPHYILFCLFLSGAGGPSAGR